MRNFKLVLSYDGTDFSGWQVQPDAATIQGTLATAVGRVTGENVLPQGSGRTDAGVHALGQVASFSLASPIPARNLLVALNDVLPASIRVLDVMEVPAEFHARKSARAKTYGYRIFRGDICPPCLIYDSCGFRVFTLSERGAAHDDSVPGQHSPKDNVPSDVPNVLHTFQILSDSLWETSATIFRDLEFPSQGVLTFCVPVLLRFRIP